MRLITSITLTFLFFLQTIFAKQSIRVLQENKSIPIETLLKSKSVWFFFKPNCPVCHAQVKEFSCLRKFSKDISKNFSAVYPVGFLGTEKDLWKESKKLGLKNIGLNRVFFGDEEIKKFFKLKGDASPQILFLDKMTKKKHHLGALNCNEISQFLFKFH